MKMVKELYITCLSILSIKGDITILPLPLLAYEIIVRPLKHRRGIRCWLRVWSVGVCGCGVCGVCVCVWCVCVCVCVCVVCVVCVCVVCGCVCGVCVCVVCVCVWCVCL